MLRKLFSKLPPSTNYWSCAWAITICYVGAFCVAIGLTIIPGLLGSIVVAFGALSILLVALTRQSGACDA
jgi:hypothetical protein